MKKLIVFLSLLSMMALVIAGCGNSDAGKTAGETKKQKLTIVTYANWNPFEYLDKGEVVGFDIDLAKEIAKEAGYEYEIKNVGWDAMFAEIKGKTADVGISGITITNERKQTYDFSHPYFISRQSIVVKQDSTVKNGEDLKEKIVAVQSGSTGQEAVEKLMGKNNEKIKKEKSGLTYMDMIHGDADAVVGDDTSNKAFLTNNPNEKVKIIQDEKSFAPEYFGLIYPKDSALKAEFDKALHKLYENGKYAELYKKWFKVDPNMEEIKAQEK
jgi:glutamine transport system substrate-binding protein